MPLAARIRLGHAVLQAIADDAGIDLLHIKGYAVDEGLYYPGRVSTDVDVLVRPEQAGAFLDAIERHGWHRVTSFETGSIFEHAAVSKHEVWGYADVHRVVPGVGLAADAAFERIWRSSKLVDIAEFPCRVPGRIEQALMIVLHDARGSSRSTADIDHLRNSLGDDEWAALREAAIEFGAEVAFAAATGTLDDYRDRPEYHLWKALRGGATRVELLRARIRSAPTLPGKITILAGAALPNRDHLRMSLGREPAASDYARDIWLRSRAAAAGLRADVRAGWHRMRTAARRGTARSRVARRRDGGGS